MGKAHTEQARQHPNRFINNTRSDGEQLYQEPKAEISKTAWRAQEPADGTLNQVVKEAKKRRPTDTKTQSILDTINDLRQAKSMVTGQEIYLAQSCPTRGDWDQCIYESLLLHIAWSFVTKVESPDNTFSPDREVFRLTSKRFPDIMRSYLVIALKHVPTQAYGRPMDVAQE